MSTQTFSELLRKLLSSSREKEQLVCLIRELKDQLRQHQEEDRKPDMNSPQGNPSTGREQTLVRAQSSDESSIASCRPAATPEELLMRVYTPTGYLPHYLLPSLFGGIFMQIVPMQISLLLSKTFPHKPLVV